MLGNVNTTAIKHICTMVIYTYVELLCCTSYVLLLAFGARDKIDDV